CARGGYDSDGTDYW
nr:immunoglobulin heavy chain junction region [Mus musculus]MBK4187195.1 immunoglobulin heavy chain junction region [Mus musculus]